MAADRRGLRYESDLTDAEWALVEPLIRPAKRGGRPRTVDVREVLNAVFYVLWTGCQWKALPKDLPPRSTVWEYLDLWDSDGSLDRIHHALYVEAARWRAAKQARRRRSSTARPRREPSKGGFAGPVRLRCRQEGGRPQALCPDRHARPVARRHRSPGQRPGPRRRGDLEPVLVGRGENRRVVARPPPKRHENRADECARGDDDGGDVLTSICPIMVQPLARLGHTDHRRRVGSPDHAPRCSAPIADG